MQDKYEDANKWKKTLSEQGCAFIAKRIAKHILATATPQQSQPAPPLIQAVLAGEPEKVCEMLVRGEKPNLVDQWGRTALFYAEETRDRNGGSRDSPSPLVYMLLLAGAVRRYQNVHLPLFPILGQSQESQQLAHTHMVVRNYIHILLDGQKSHVTHLEISKERWGSARKFPPFWGR